MTRILAVMAVLSLAACTSAPDERQCREAEYCPGCNAFCGENCPKDDKGACKACGKTPAKAMVCELQWFWCKSHSAWHAGKPCSENASKSCCEGSKKTTALCTEPGLNGIEKAKYCPACQCFCGTECPLDEKGNCKKCAKPAVEVDAIVGTWHWCDAHKVWHVGKACGDHASKACCKETKARVVSCGAPAKK